MNLVNFEFDPSEKFEPSQATKKAGLATHKSQDQYAGVTLPGFFETTGYSWQLIGFFCIFLLEGAATFWSYSEGASVQIIIGLILLDVVLAIGSHWQHQDIVIYRNQLIFEKGAFHKKIAGKLNKALAWCNFFYFLIISSAVTKFWFFFMIYMFFDATALLIAFFYLLGGVLHILCTGYALFTTRFKIAIGKEHKKYIQSVAEQFRFTPLEQEIDSGGMDLTPVTVGLHEIVEKEGKFFFRTNGILNDRELGNFIAHQSNDHQRRIVAVEGIRHQYNIYGMEPGQIIEED